ncbi:adenine phosphoribosyltransferase [Brockia lithotrophica]|uniref:Adenine phosphoribosyltransferase n=1 Tax=Brockia lithotrophica TaxID=933949 RepID=A0A660L6T6_9BACL|nr:adenine phosphoribosyltransferase [Brockia lithotrophica]
MRFRVRFIGGAAPYEKGVISVALHALDPKALEERLKKSIRTIPDYPQPGILFYDITTLFQDPEAYKLAIDHLVERVRPFRPDVIVGPEARGFVVGGPLAYALGVGFAFVRKPGKLPREVVTAEYEKEYGPDSLAIHRDALLPGQRVVVADDLLATGGTMGATVDLVRKLGGEVVAAAFLIELAHLGGRKFLLEEKKVPEVVTLVRYSGEG